MSDKAPNDRDPVLEDRARQAFRDSADALDAATLSRLNRARQQALAELKPDRAAFGTWIPLGVTAALAAVAVAVWVNRAEELAAPDLGAGIVQTAAEEDLSIMLDGENLDMLAELEFYDWVGTEAELRGDGEGAGSIG